MLNTLPWSAEPTNASCYFAYANLAEFNNGSILGFVDVIRPQAQRGGGAAVPILRP